MQDAPDRDVLLDAVAGFLADDVVPAIADPALQFRVKIALHLLGGLAREGRAEDAADAEHLRLLDPAATVPDGRAARRAAIRAAAEALARRIRTGELDGDLPAWADRLRAVALEKARTGNPRFR